MKEVLETNISNYPLIKRGKVRDIYQLDDERLLIIATDRLSAFDSILPNGIPGRGKILTKMSVFWFKFMEDIVPNHLLEWRADKFPAGLSDWRDVLENRSMIVHIADRIDVECVVRGYLAGSGWRSYQETGTVCGIDLPGGLSESARFENPIFTPSTKAESGHDENISYERMATIIDSDLAEKIRDVSLKIYQKASQYAIERNMIIADTKFEFGLSDGKLILIDEILSPDSSRFWDLDTWEEGVHQRAYDKEFIRTYLRNIGWQGDGEIPTLPDDIIQATLQRYQEAYERLVPEDFFNH
ncbi:phosphoribosylaminoimidazolesuccinocarboxamide synthase [bacterium]|nr:phosphoribosylaminoimidazolesuccinocarboxamide synthase [bacterium]